MRRILSIALGALVFSGPVSAQNKQETIEGNGKLVT